MRRPVPGPASAWPDRGLLTVLALALAAGSAASVELKPGNIVLADRSTDPFGFGDARGAIFVADEGPPVQVQLTASPNGFVDPFQTLPLADGRIIVVDASADPGGGRSGGVLWVVDPTLDLPGQAELFAWSTQWDNPIDILQEASGDLLVLDSDADPLGVGTHPGALYRVNFETHAVVPLATSTYWVDPRSMAFDIDGSVLVWDSRADPYNLGGFPGALFRVFPASGLVEVIFSKPEFLSPWAVEVAPDGDYLVLDRDANPNGHEGAPGGVFRVDRSTLEVEAAVFPSNFSEPVDCISAPNNQIYVLDQRANPFGYPTAAGAVFRCDLQTGQVTNTISSGFFRVLCGISQFKGTALDSSLVAWEDLSGPPFQPGDRMRVTIRARNTGEVPGRPVTMEHDLGENWEYRLGSAVASSGTIGYDPGLRQVRWSGDIEVGGSVDLAYEIRVNDALPPGTELQEKVSLKVGRTSSPFTLEATTAYRFPPGRYVWADYEPAGGTTRGIIFEKPDGAAFPARVFSGAPLVQPDDVAFLLDGTLAVLDRRSRPRGPDAAPGGIYRLDPYTQSVTDTLLAMADHPELHVPLGIAAGDFDELLIIDKDANPLELPGAPGAVFSMDLRDGALAPVASDARWSEPADAIRTTTGEILLVDYDADPFGDNPRGGGVFEIDRSTGDVNPIQVPPGNFVDPVGIAEAPGRRFFVADVSADPLLLRRNTGAIFEIRRTGGDEIQVASADSFYVDPTDVWVQPDGRLIVTDREANPLNLSPRDRGAVFRVRPFVERPEIVSAHPSIYGPEALAGVEEGNLFLSSFSMNDENGAPAVGGDTLSFEAMVRNAGPGLVPEAMAQVLLSEDLSLIEAGGVEDLVVDPAIGAVGWFGRIAPADTVRIRVRAFVREGLEYGALVHGVLTVSGPGAPPPDSAIVRVVAPLGSRDVILVDGNADPNHLGHSNGALFHLRSDRLRVEQVLRTDTTWVDPTSVIGLDEGRLLMADQRGIEPGTLIVVDYMRDTVEPYLEDPRLGAPWDLFRTRSGDLLIVDPAAILEPGQPSRPVVWKQAGGSGPLTVLCSDSLLFQPAEITEDDQNRLWLIDRRADPNGDAPGRGALLRLDPQSGAILDTLQFGAFSLPSGVLNWPEEGLIVIDEFAVAAPNTRGAVFQIDPDAGTLRTRVTDQRFRALARGTFVSSGELWLSDRLARDETLPGSPRTLFRWDPETNDVEPVAASSQYVTPGEIYALPGPNPRIAAYAYEDVNGSPLRPGDRVAITARVENIGPVETAGAVYLDTLPALFLFDPASIRADAGIVVTTPTVNGLEWTVDLPPGASYEIHYEANVRSSVIQGARATMRSHLRTVEGVHRVRRIPIRFPVYFEEGYMYLADSDADPLDVGGSPGCVWKVNLLNGQSTAMASTIDLVQPVQVLAMPTTEPNLIVIDSGANPHNYAHGRGCLWRWVTNANAFTLVAADSLFGALTSAIALNDHEILLLDRVADPFDLRQGIGPGALFRVDTQTGQVTTVASDSLFATPRDVIPAGEGAVYIIDSDADPNRYGLRNGAVLRLDLATGKVTVHAASADFRGPIAATVGPDGALYVLDREVRPFPNLEARGAVFRVDAHGNIARYATSRYFRRLADLEFDNQGKLFVSDADADPLGHGRPIGAIFRRDTPSDPDFRIFATPLLFENPEGFFLRGVVTPIELTAFEATPTEDGVVLTWEVPEAEFDGFVLWRAEGIDPEAEAYEPLNPEAPVRGQGSLRYVDWEAEAGRTYSYMIEALAGGAGSRFFGPVHATAITVRVFALRPPAPNPARSSVTLTIDLPAPGEPELTIYELTGRRVRRIAPGPLGAGSHPIVWDVRNERGHPVASGLYLARLRWRDRSATRRIVILR